MRLIVLAILCILPCHASGQSATIDFEVQAAPACQVAFPTPRGAVGDPESVSWNGAGLATVDRDNGCGFPVSGSRYLRVNSVSFNGGIGQGGLQAGMPPAALNFAAEAYVRIPPGFDRVSFAWDFYTSEAPMQTIFNDGMLVDVVDATGNRLALLAFADTFTDQAACGDGIGDLVNPPTPAPTACANVDAMNTVFNGTEIDPTGMGTGPQIVSSAAIPAGGVFLRLAVWNGVDDSNNSSGVLDDVVFSAAAPPTYPGTGEDLIALAAVRSGALDLVAGGGDVLDVPAGDLVQVRFESPSETFVGLGSFLALGAVGVTPDPLPVPFPNIYIDPTTAFLILGGTVGGFPIMLPTGGAGFSFVNTGALPGLTFGIQGFVINGMTGNGIFASTNALELRLQ